MRIPSLAELVGIARVSLPEEPDLPTTPRGYRPVYLLDAATGLEERLLRGWLRRAGAPPGHGIVRLSPSRIRRRRIPTDPRVRTELGERSWLVPLRVVWMPAERRGRRTVSWVDLLKLGDPRDPRWFRDYLILALFRDRVQILAGEGASGAELMVTRTAGEGVIDHVRRRAFLALDRAERKERGNRYKIPRFVAEDISSRPEFRRRAIELGRERRLSAPRSLSRARYYLREIAATHSPFLIDLIANLIHWVIRQGYRTIHYDPSAMQRIAALGRDRCLVFLPSHKSNLDRLTLQFLLWENDLPPNHTAGGINMNFFPIGPLVRRTGVFFIRRTFRENDLYKHVLRSYLDYLIEKRLPLEWYLEGGRSRTGKLRPPRYGLLAWVVDSHARSTTEDVYLVPVSIAYDHIQEVAAYAREAAGGDKERESFSWALRFARNLRRPYGDIHVRFAEPVSVAEEVKGADLTDEEPIEVRKLAFEVMHRIAMATPVTPTALVTTVFLAAKGRALQIADITRDASRLAGYVRRRDLPVTVPELPSDDRTVGAMLAWMAEHRLVSSETAGSRTVHWMNPQQKLTAAYYANSVIHYFIPRGMAEIALGGARDLSGFWSDIFALRDLLKFEFFFADRDRFRASVAAELAAEAPGWEALVESGRGHRVELMPSVAGFAVVPLLEAYRVVADELLDGSFGTEKGFLRRCLARGRIYRLEGEITSDETVSQVVYGNALRLARHRKLVDDRPGVYDDRRLLANELAGYRDRYEASQINPG